MTTQYTADYPLSGNDIIKIVDTNVIEYATLYNIDNIDDVLKNGSCVILYKTSDKFGHWCCITTNKNKICFFDPYGYLIDSEIKEFINNDFGKNYYKGKKLVELLYKSKYKNVEYNDNRLQKMIKNNNTCGRHCCTKIMFKDLSLVNYIKMCNDKTMANNPDDFVISVTNFYI